MRILETCLYGEDLEAARAFYVDLLGLEEVSFDPQRDLFMKAEGSMLIYSKASKTLIPDAGVPPHGTTGPGHLAFEATGEALDEWHLKLKKAGVAITQEVNWKNGARSIYFEDPAGNVIEIATRNLWY